LPLRRRGSTPTSVNMLVPKKHRLEVYKYLFRGACAESSELWLLGAAAPTQWRGALHVE